MKSAITKAKSLPFVLVIGGAAALFGSFVIVKAAVATSVCRGIDCLNWTTDKENSRRSSVTLENKCLYLGEPIGIGIFNSRKLGGLIQSIMVQEYGFFGTEFLYIISDNITDPILVINANKYFMDIPEDSFCADKVDLEFLEESKKILVRAEDRRPGP